MWKKVWESLTNWYQPAISYEGVRQFRQWRKTPQGCKLADSQQAAWSKIAEQLGSGYHFMQLGVPLDDNTELGEHYSHCFTLDFAEHGQPTFAAIASYDELPLPSDTIDLVLLNHALEYGENPHKILSEAYRVTMPGGYIIIATLNPISLFGLYALFKRLFSRQALWQRYMFRRGRLHDWLKLLHLQPVFSTTTGYFLPIKSGTVLGKFPSVRKLLSSGRLPFAACQLIVAKKVVSRPVGMNKISWQIKPAADSPVSRIRHSKVENPDRVIH